MSGVFCLKYKKKIISGGGSNCQGCFGELYWEMEETGNQGGTPTLPRLQVSQVSEVFCSGKKV